MDIMKNEKLKNMLGNCLRNIIVTKEACPK